MKSALLVFIMLLLGSTAGCTENTATPPKVANTPRPAVKRADPGDPNVKEARAELEALLNAVLSGKLQQLTVLSEASRSVDAKSWLITIEEASSQPPLAVRFGGIFKGPRGEAPFTVGMVKQQDGTWKPGHGSNQKLE